MNAYEQDVVARPAGQARGVDRSHTRPPGRPQRRLGLLAHRDDGMALDRPVPSPLAVEMRDAPCHF